MIQLAQQFRGLKFLRRDAAQNSRGDRAVKRRGAAFSADVAERDAQLLRTVAQEIVQVAANFARRKNARRDVQSEIFLRHGTQQRALHALRGVQFALHARFVARELLVQPRIFERNGKMSTRESKASARVLR